MKKQDVGAIALPGGKRICLQHVVSFEPGGDLGIRFELAGCGAVVWEAPRQINGRAASVQERQQLLGGALKSLDQLLGTVSEK